MKRLQFILSTLVTTIVGLIASESKASPLAEAPKLMTWSERIAKDEERTHSRRYEHLLHAKYCRGSLDHLSLPKEVAERQASCAKVCGLCRYINSLAVWPDQKYRRPPESFLKALGEQPWCVTYRSEPPYKMITTSLTSTWNSQLRPNWHMPLYENQSPVLELLAASDL